QFSGPTDSVRADCYNCLHRGGHRLGEILGKLDCQEGFRAASRNSACCSRCQSTRNCLSFPSAVQISFSDVTSKAASQIASLKCLKTGVPLHCVGVSIR